MRVAIMQPYVFPYIGYFQLINAVDQFIFYDDVNFIKRGYINRNNILVQEEKHRFVIPCKGMSQNKKINEVELFFDEKAKAKFLKTISLSYQKAPFFDEIYTILNKFIDSNTSKTISDFAMQSVKLIANYLELKVKWSVSSSQFNKSQALKKEARLIHITKECQADTYINPIGGQELYHKAMFKKHDISLYFLKSNPVTYQQFTNDFVPWLSIIDVLMFNSVSDIKTMLNDFELV